MSIFYFTEFFFYPHTNFFNGNCPYAIQCMVDLFYICLTALYHDLKDFSKGTTVKHFFNKMMVLKGHSKAKCEYDILTLISNMNIMQIFHLKTKFSTSILLVTYTDFSYVNDKILFFIRKVIFFHT